MTGDYQVGKNRPPLHTRFKKGKSGNPSGKRKPKPSVSQQINSLLERKINASENGKPVKITVQEAILTKLTDNALKGDLKAAMTVFNLRNASHSETDTTIDPAILAPGDRELGILSQQLRRMQRKIFSGMTLQLGTPLRTPPDTIGQCKL